MSSIGPWMLKELLGAGHGPGERSTNPYLLGVVFERLPAQLQERCRREEAAEGVTRLELVAAVADHIAAVARKCAAMLKNQEHPKVYCDSKAEWLAGKAEND